MKGQDLLRSSLGSIGEKIIRTSIIVVIIITLVLISLLSINNGYAATGEKMKIIFTDGRKSFEYTLKELNLLKWGNWLYCYNSPDLRYKLNLLREKVDEYPINARMVWSEQKCLEIIPEIAGRELDLEALVPKVATGASYRAMIELPFKTIEAEINSEKLAQCLPRELWAEYSTVLADVPNRMENIKVAAESLDGIIILPREEVSFNSIVGPRNTERGFLPAPIIMGGKFEMGIGGGICQVSSTLYNTVLLAGLEIKERYNHSVAIAYVPLGRDATVVYGSKDLKFTNNSGCNLLLRTKVEGNRLNMSLYGPGAKPFGQVSIRQKTIKVFPYKKIYQEDNSLREIKTLTKGQNGYLVETSRLFCIEGKEIEEVLSRDYFAPINKIIAIPVNSPYEYNMHE